MDTGNTVVRKYHRLAGAVHPRGYGKHISRLSTYDASIGSSPWIRETLITPSTLKVCARFIPVDTGNTNTVAVLSDQSSVHPRGYGKHPRISRTGRRLSGSSPWIRETHQPQPLLNRHYRFIPVDTGNTKER